MLGSLVGGDHGVELQAAEALLAAGLDAVLHQLAAKAEAARGGCHGEAGVGDVRAAPDAVGMQDVHAEDDAVHIGHHGSGLSGEELVGVLLGQRRDLRERVARFHDLVPDAHHGLDIVCGVRTDLQLHWFPLSFSGAPLVRLLGFSFAHYAKPCACHRSKRFWRRCPGKAGKAADDASHSDKASRARAL